MKQISLVLIVIFLVSCSSKVSVKKPKIFTLQTKKFHKEYKEFRARRAIVTIDWLEKASKSNYAFASHDLGLKYITAKGVSKDYKKAYLYFGKSARLGIHNSMRSLGLMWKIGEGRKKDLSKAYAWYRLAGDHVPTDWNEWSMPRSKVMMFKLLATNLKKKMTKDEISAGNDYYVQFKSKIRGDFYTWLSTLNP